MKGLAKRLWRFSSLDYKTAESYLEKMAVKKISTVCLVLGLVLLAAQCGIANI